MKATRTGRDAGSHEGLPRPRVDHGRREIYKLEALTARASHDARDQIRRKIFRRYIQRGSSQNTSRTRGAAQHRLERRAEDANGAAPRCRTSAAVTKCSIVQLMT